MNGIRVFISYSHENDVWLQEWLDERQTKRNPRYLLNLWERAFRNQQVVFWYDRSQETGLGGGDRWRTRILEEIDRADVAILLVTQDFIVSPFIRDEELPRILERGRQGAIEILPILLEPAHWKDLELHGMFQLTPGRPTPLTQFESSDHEWKTARNEILEALTRTIERAREKRNPPVSGPIQPARETEAAINSETVQRLAAPAQGCVAEPQRASAPTRRVASDTEAEAIPRGPLVELPAVNRPINLGFDGPVVRGLPDGWFDSFGHVPGVSLSYQCRVVPRPETNGSCLVLQKQGAHETEFGSVMQRCLARRLAGKTVRFQAELRSQDVLRWAGLWLRADGEKRADLYFDNMHRRPIRGTTDWTTYRIDAQLPTLTWWLNYGVVLFGDGHLWVDDCRLLVWHEDDTWQEW
jgi:hypothetical protein